MLTGEGRVAGILPDRRRAHRHPWLLLADASGEIAVGGRDELAEPCSRGSVAVECLTQLIEGRSVETEPRRHAERRREAPEIGGLAADRRGVEGPGLTQPGDSHGARV